MHMRKGVEGGHCAPPPPPKKKKKNENHKFGGNAGRIRAKRRENITQKRCIGLRVYRCQVSNGTGSFRSELPGTETPILFSVA